jgi:hypothetical protein
MENLDVIRRYAPSVTTHPQETLAGCLRVEGTCWVWTRGIAKDGYGWLTVYDPEIGQDSMQAQGVHRYMCDLLVGDIPPTYEIHHRCENKACWNPTHLEVVTSKEHKARHRAIRAMREVLEKEDTNKYTGK